MDVHAFDNEFSRTVKSERKLTNQILRMILTAEDLKIYLTLGYSTLFKWLTQGHGYSGSCAQQRIQAARLLRSVPSTSAKLEEGSLNLSNVARAQAVMRASEKAGGDKLSVEEKETVIEQLQSKTTFEAERVLLGMFPEVAELARPSTKKVINTNTVRITVDVPIETYELLNRSGEVLSHKIPDGGMAEILKALAMHLLDHEDPLRKEVRPRRNTESENRCIKKDRAIPKAVQRVVIKKAMGACEYQNTTTGKICGEKSFIEIDHIRMRAHGGGNELENLRCLCRAHNQLLAEQQLGKAKANEWRRVTRAESP